jgi:hypothetical protein
LETLHFIGRYSFDFSGIYLGSLVFNVDETPDTYTVHLLVKSGGIINLFTRHWSDTEATGKRLGNRYLPQHYESHYKTKDKPRHLKLAFNAKGAITEELVEPPEDRTDRPEVPHALKDGAHDPFSGFMALRAGSEKLHVFDAKRLYEITAQPVGITSSKIAGYYAKAYDLSRIPLAGMTQKEMSEYKKDEPHLTFYFSNDARRIPLAMTMPAYFGRVEGRLTKECKTWEECIK